ncbi:hypothetical protein Gpo141_00012861 [Globisporangium polare]
MPAISTLLLDGHGGLSEAQLVVLVLAVLVVAVALLSYFVVAPEYEKRLEKQYVAALAQHEKESAAFLSDSAPFSSSSASSVSSAFAAERYLAVTRTKLSKHRSLGRWDIEAASSSDDDAHDHHLQRSLREAEEEAHHAAAHVAALAHEHERMGGDGLSMSCGPPRSMNSALHLHRSGLTEAQRVMLARRRKSESDALKLANVNRAEMLRRRVLLKKLEEEIKGAMKETDAANSSSSSSAPSSLRGDVRRSSNDALYLTEDKLRMLQEHPADCSEELSILAAQTQQQPQDPIDEPAATLTSGDIGTTTEEPLAADNASSEIKQALQTLHDVLSFYLSTDHRDMNKLTVFCNSLLAHDGLNHLRAFEVSVDQDVRTLANAIIEKAVPAIWH